MILVIKPLDIPSKLIIEGQAENIINELAYDIDPQAYINGRPITIKPAIYNHKLVKPVLKKAQYYKCCYCEKDQRDEPGAVEHYRPKNGYKSVQKEELKKPGYYWLGYSWKNFYFTCCACNTVKANYFPLVDETTRAKSHHDDVNQEEPYLLEPAGPKDPRLHIIFDNQFVRGISDFGRATIKICGLDRDGLNEKRNELISRINTHIAAVVLESSASEASQEAKRFLINCQEPTAEFSATAIDYLRQFNIQVG